MINISKKYLMEVYSGSIKLENAIVDVYTPNLKKVDISNIKSKGIRKIIIGVTNDGIPILFRGDLNTEEIVNMLNDKAKNLKFEFFFEGDLVLRKLYLAKNSPQDWQYKIGKQKIKHLKRELLKVFNNWSLPF